MSESEMLQEVQDALGVSPLIPLKAGGQKRVYRSTLEGADVAVKMVLIPTTADGPEVRERAIREVEILGDIDSPYVVRALSGAVEVGNSPSAVCWAEEFLDGEDLVDTRTNFPLTEQEAFNFIHDVAHGLAEFHDLDVVHRDLSPGNVRRRSDSSFTVMDPGYARHLSKAAITGIYQPGTMGYISPEHVPGGSPTPASDIFVLGILGFEILTGRNPIPYLGDQGAYFMALTAGNCPSVNTNGKFASGIATIVDRCLLRQPARRYLDALELLEDLSNLPSMSRG